MKLRLRSICPRHGTTIVEMAIVGPLTFLLLIGLVVGGLGVFRYNQVAALARESARWAAVRGRTFERVEHGTPITKADLLSNVIVPRATALDLDRLSCDLTWDDKKRVVCVTVEYQWLPEAFFPAMKLISSATSVVSN